MAMPRIKRGQRYRQLLHLNPCVLSLCLLTTRVTKATRATLALIEGLNDFKLCTHDWHQHQLCNAFTHLNAEVLLTTVPTRNKQLTLIIRIDQTDQVTQHNTVLMTQ